MANHKITEQTSTLLLLLLFFVVEPAIACSIHSSNPTTGAGSRLTARGVTLHLASTIIVILLLSTINSSNEQEVLATSYY